MATKCEQWVLYSHVTTKPIVHMLSFDKIFFEKNFVKWQQSLNNGFCTHMWLQNPLFKLCYHLTSFFVKTKKCHLPFTLELSSFERTFLFYYNVNPVIRKWQHRILLTSSFMLEKFPSHSASPRGLESFLAFMTWWVKSYVVISSSQDWYISKISLNLMKFDKIELKDWRNWWSCS